MPPAAPTTTGGVMADTPIDIVDRYPQPDTATLTAADRCDQCGAQAYVTATVNGTDLLYCLHHYNVNARALSKVATSTRMQLPPWWSR